MEAQANRKFGRYEILGELGRGAMGVVYKARDPQISRLVAVKTVLLRGQEPEEEQEFRKRFLGEAQAAGRLHHPGIVAIYDVGEDLENRDPYLVLEFVGGESLNRILSREKKLPLPRALQLALEITEALDYAHAQGVVHRDIKPANILINEEGRAKITDLGIAQLNLAHFTLPGRVLGTPAYMAPEQLSGEGVDGRSDLFSLGVILYSMVTGHSPFQGNSATTVCFKVVNRDPMPASALDMDLPPALDAVISKAMAKDPDKRYQRGSEFAEDLRRLMSQPASPASAWMQARDGRNSSTTEQGRLNPNAAAGLVSAVQLLRNTVGKTGIGRGLVASAFIVTLTMLAIPIRRAIVAKNSAHKPVQANAGVAAEQNSSASALAANGAKPRDSIVAEMEVPVSVPSPDAPAAAHVRTKAVLRSATKVAAVKPRPAPIPASPAPTAVAAKPLPVASSTLELAIEHQFKEATLFVWVDNELVLTRPLHGGTQKKLVVFKGFHGLETETVKLPAGNHQLHFRAQSSDQTIDLSKTIAGDFAPGEDKTLQVTFDKRNTEMRFAWRQPASN